MVELKLGCGQFFVNRKDDMEKRRWLERLASCQPTEHGKTFVGGELNLGGRQPSWRLKGLHMVHNLVEIDKMEGFEIRYDNLAGVQFER